MGHPSRPLRGNFCLASKRSAALWSKTAARCFAFSSGHTSIVDSVPFGSIRTTCHPKALASYRSRFILRICAPCRPQAAKGGGRTRQPFALLPYVGRFRFYLANCPPCGRAWSNVKPGACLAGPLHEAVMPPLDRPIRLKSRSSTYPNAPGPGECRVAKRVAGPLLVTPFSKNSRDFVSEFPGRNNRR
jgi:hypothetical protein